MPLTPEQQADQDMSERALSKEFDQLRKREGWRAHGVRIGFEKRAAVRHGDKGFPDWFLMRRGRAMGVELKDQDGELSAEQVIWQDLFHLAKMEWYCLRPSDLRLGIIADILR